MLEVVLFGEFRVCSEGSLVAGLRSPRTQALLGYLALHPGTPQPRQHVANLFWPDSTEAQARTNLRRELHALRAGLPDPDGVLAVDQSSVWWRDDGAWRIDVASFAAAADHADAAIEHGDATGFAESARTAVALYGGDFLPALYDDWVLAQRERLCRRCVSLLDGLIEVVAGDDIGSAATYARRRVELQPLEEVGHRTLVDLLARTGDRAAALQAYHRCISVLERDLDVPPSPETVEVYQRLFEAESRTDPDRARAPARQRSPFVGREDELLALRTAWAEATAEGPGSARLVAISGEAGIGKSRLADELLATVRQAGGVAASARCFAGERPPPLAPVAEWLRSDVLRHAIERLEHPWRAEVARLVPELGTDLSADGGGSVQSGDTWFRHRFFEGLVRAVLAVGQPTALLLDDVQWCDLDTLVWLELCLYLGADAPLLVITTMRSEEVHDNPDLVALLGRLRASGTVVDVDLSPLREDQTAELATLLLGPDVDTSSVARLQALAGGFPLFVVEAARSRSHEREADLEARGSPRVQAVLAGRFTQLSAGAQDLAGLAAAIGRDFSLDLLAEASDMEADGVVDALDELWRRRLVREQSATTYDFSHDLLRAAAYDKLSPPQQRRLHRRVAQALALLHADGLDAVAGQIADQYDRGGLGTRAVPFFERAVEEAARVFAYRQAVQLAERALSLLAGLPPSPQRDARELKLRAASAEPRNAVGGWTSTDAQQNLEKILELSERTGDRSLEVVSLVGLWGMSFVQGRLAEGLSLAERALAASDDNAGLSPYAHMAVAGSLTSAGDPRRALPHFEVATSPLARADFEVLGFAPRVMSWGWSAHACWLTGRVDEARVRAATAIETADDLTMPFGRAMAIAYAAITHQLRGDRRETLELSQEVQELSARYEVAYYQHWGEVLEGWVRGGDEGAALMGEGIRRLRERGVASRLPYYLALLAETLIDAGRAAHAAAVLAEAGQLAQHHADWWWLPELYRLEARLHPGPDGDEQLERALAVAGDHGSASLALRAGADLAERLVERDDVDRGRRLLRPLRAACVGTSPELEATDTRLDRLIGVASGAGP
jgi:DNA-binding SARP family transcriptional activator/tetratricopeptide (TPR) repeat protein